jgi:hypothetical protein
VTLAKFAATVVVALSLTIAAIGPAFGYAALPAAAACGLMVGLLVASSVLLVDRFFPGEGTVDALIRASIVSLAIVVLTTMVLGAAGWLTAAREGLFLAAVLAAALWLTRSRPHAATCMSVSAPIAQLAVPAALLCVVIAYGLLHSPLTAYDSLSYHLFFPARWLQEQAISIIPTPFSDPAQAYAPANGELYFLWLMLPLHGDLLARIGQVPFLALIGLGLYDIARRLGASRSHAMWPVMFCFVSRPIVEQAVGADVDLICWSLFLASLSLGLRGADSDRRRDWLLFGAALGLYLGTKYVALVYAPIAAALLLVRAGWPPSARVVLRRIGWSLPGIALFAIPWYLRNWIVAGSPLYPASLDIGGITLAQGAFTRAAMRLSVFHTTDVRLLPVMLAHAFGTTLLLSLAPFLAIGAWRLLRAYGSAGRWLIVMPVLMVALYWFGVPDNIDSRFMLPIALLALIPAAFVFGTWRAGSLHIVSGPMIHVLYAGVLLWTLVGIEADIPATLPWFMGGWLSLRGLVSLPVPGLTAAVLGLIVAMLEAASKTYRPAVLILLIATGSAVLTRVSWPWCGPAPCEYLRTTSIFLRPTFLQAWQWTDRHVTDATIAYTGNNVPYPLAGSHLRNRVRYVNIDRHTTWRFHDYDHAARLRLNRQEGDLLAVPSGVLLPLGTGDRTVEAVRPRHERMRGDRAAWIGNLQELGVSYLFISALSAYEIDFNRHDAAGFPVEDDWARAEPDIFRLAYENPQVRIYAVNARRRPS